jgi:hypothetical protein
MSDIFYEIEQKERPKECALCNVSHGVHAMFPLFDYHGEGGRQICYPVKDNKKRTRGSPAMALAWGHALCCLYLAAADTLVYACFKDGDYIGMEDNDNVDQRPPNPELVETDEFKRMYGDVAMPHYRYFMTPTNRPPCDWTKTVIDRKRRLQCVECGLDDRKSMRIPVQCVANNPDEYSEHKSKHDKDEPCMQAHHVGCARWGCRGEQQSTIQKVYYFPGLVNDDGSIKANVDTVKGVYCKLHAEDLDPEHEERKKKQRQKKQAENEEKQKWIQQVEEQYVTVPRSYECTDSSAVNSNPDSSLRLMKALPKAKRDINTNIVNNFGKKKPVSGSASAPPKKHKDKEGWGVYYANANLNKGDRHQELDSSEAVAVTAGAKMSVVDDNDIDRVFNDLVSHIDEIAKDTTSTLNGRRHFWKHKFSELSTSDFDSIWKVARNKFFLHQGKYQNNKQKNVTHDSSNSIDLIDIASEGTQEEEDFGKISTKTKKEESDTTKCDSEEDDGKDAMDIDDETHQSESNEKMAEEQETETDNMGCNNKLPKRKDQWSKLFIGQTFQLGCEFTLDEWEFDEKL